jgi:hypothetical protein
VDGADIDNDDLVQNHEDEARSLMRALVDANHFFKRKKAEALASSRKRCTELQKMQNDEEWECFYETQAASLEGATLSVSKPFETSSPWP